MKYKISDYKLIKNWINEKSTVLDLGCGNGELMEYLTINKKAQTHGIEISEPCIYKCVQKGLNVFHGDIENALKDFPNKSFDFVILYQSLQQIKDLAFVLRESLRVGNEVIVCFPNFAYIKSRLMLFFMGKAPVTSRLPYTWDNTPNLHFFSIKDFINFCFQNHIHIINKCFMHNHKKIQFMPNLVADRAIFKIKEQTI